MQTSKAMMTNMKAKISSKSRSRKATNKIRNKLTMLCNMPKLNEKTFIDKCLLLLTM